MDSLLVLLIVILGFWFGGVIARSNRRLDVLERSHETLERFVRHIASSEAFADADAARPGPAVSVPASVDPPVAPEAQPTPVIPRPEPTPVIQTPEPPPVTPKSEPPTVLSGNQVPIEPPPPRDLEPAVAAAVLTPPAFESELREEHRKTELDLERVIAGSWLNRIGIVALLVAMAFFLKLAIDKNWIGPIERISIGLVAGVGLLGYSQLLFKKGYGYFSEGMVALGGGVLYLSLFAGWNLYHLIPVPVAFVGMVLVTSTVLGISLARDSQRLAFLAMVGGFVTPLLLNTGTDNEVGLFSYLAVLNAGLLWVAYVRDWRSLPLAFLFTLTYAWGWYDLYYEPHKLAITAFFAVLFYVEFGVLPVVSARRTGNLPNEQMPMVLFNATWFTFAATDMLYEHHRLTLAVLMLALSAAHFIVARTAAAHEPPTARVVYDAMCFTFLAIAIGVGLQGPWIAIGWSVQGTALVLAGLRGRSRVLRMEGLVLFVLVVARLAAVPHETGRFLLNGEFGTFAVIVACIGYAAYRAYRQPEILAPGELSLYKAAGAVANALAVWALSRELWNLDLRQGLRGFDLTVLWSVYGGILVLVGNVRRSVLFQWQGIVLVAMSVLCEAVNFTMAPSDIVSPQTPWVAMLWSFLGAIFVWRGVFWQARVTRIAGQLLLVTAVVWVLIMGIPGGTLVLNPRFGTLAFIIACYSVAAACGRGARQQLSHTEAQSYDVLAIAVNALALWALSDEVLSIRSLGGEPAQLVLTLLWTIYAAALMVLGLRRGSPFLRWQSLTLLGIVIVKVFLVDLSVLPLGLRILSFLVLGLVLMAVSFFYQRKLQSQRTGKA